MASVIHIAEVAAILSVAYVLGWVIGYAAHRLAGRPRATVATAPAEPNAAAIAPAADALVKAPVIEPVPNTPPPQAPPPPAPAPAAPVAQPILSAEPEATAPAVPLAAAEAGHTLAPIAIPVVSVPPMQIEPLPQRARPPADPEPPPLPEPEIVLTAAPAMRPGEAWSGEVRGRTAVAVTSVETAAVTPDVTEPPPTELPLTIDLGELGPDSTYGDPIVPPPAPTPAPEPVAAKPLDEDAAMRAIEGGWSRVKTRAMSDAPELSDVGAAVAAAQSAVEQVLAKAGIDAEASRQSARPKGLPRARNGKRDDLKRINGLGALDESTLNNLGVFHFDQIAGWSEAQVLWMENHVFARGRIGHENWQQQARNLAPPAGS
jgi:predicted flap endonuclease-1-like 5' DNA nuclease